MSIASEPHPACSVEARITRVTAVCCEHVLIEAAVSDFPPSTPGQFLQLLCQDGHTDAPDTEREWPADAFPSIQGADFLQRRPYLRRPFSIADRYHAADGTTRLCVISRTVGVGTAWLEHLRAGGVLNLTGPLGRGFRIPVEPRPLLLIGGGVGIPPLLYLARELHARGHPAVYLVFGALRADLGPLRPPSDLGLAGHSTGGTVALHQQEPVSQQLYLRPDRFAQSARLGYAYGLGCFGRSAARTQGIRGHEGGIAHQDGPA